MKDKHHTLSFKKDVTPLLALALPLMIMGIVQSSVNFLEVFFLAQLGEEVLAAGALVAALFFTLIVMIFGLFSAVNVLIAHQYGANDKKSMVLTLRDGLLLSLLLVVPTFFLFRHIAPIFLLFGQKPTLVPLAQSYLDGLSWGLLPRFILIVLFEFIIGLGHTRLSMFFTMAAIPLYIFFSYVLIFGKLGFKAFGIAGAGWGVAISDWITTIVFVLYLILHKDYREYLKSIFTMRTPSYLWELLEIGIPMGLMFSVEVGFFFAMALLMGLIDIQSLAANQITFQYLGPLMGVIFSIAQAITVRMGHLIGAQEMAAARRASYTGILLSALLMFVVALFYWLTPNYLIAVDITKHNSLTAETIAIAKSFFFIAAFFQILESVRIALFGALRGLKDTRFTLLASIISFWGIALPLGYIFATVLAFKGEGYWLGLVAGAGVSALLLYGRLLQKLTAYRFAFQ